MQRDRWLWWAKPVSRATSAIDILPSLSSRRAVIALNPQTLREVAHDCGYEDPSFEVAVLPASRSATAFYGAIRKAAAGALPEDGVIELMVEALRLAQGRLI
jgi:DNA-binding NarL/FixJ family response regulator